MPDEKPTRSKFPPLYWLVVMFEFFERGSYYGMMSVLSVYMTDELGYAKQDVGLIKGVIQPLLYFLPIISGALADRFGYRKTLLVAFALLGGGYFLVSQNTDYSLVFLSLVVMGLGAGTFKPIISGTIARCTDESNSTLGFGIFYWSINLGAFLFPLILVPLLKNSIGYEWVFIASAVGTGAMIIPTLLGFKEPPLPEEEAAKKKDKPSLLQTLANAFEIIYSPIILLHAWSKRSVVGLVVTLLVLGAVLGVGGWQFATPSGTTLTFVSRAYDHGDHRLVVHGQPNLCKAEPWEFEPETEGAPASLSLYDPDRLEEYQDDLLETLDGQDWLAHIRAEDLARMRDESVAKTILDVRFGTPESGNFSISGRPGTRVSLVLRSAETWEEEREEILAALAEDPHLASLPPARIDEIVGKASNHPFILAFVGMLLALAMVILRLTRPFQSGSTGVKVALLVGTVVLLEAVLWLLPGLSIFTRILCSVIGVTLLSLFAIDYDEMDRFKDHFRFLAMVVIYSGFWILYFQMFDSVLWYVQSYVDPTSLDTRLGGLLSLVGLNWHFDVEHVTVINALTIICLQIIVSSIVKNTKALPTMVAGIAIGTSGMAILAISTNIWVFMAGIVIFSIGEMTAHPKFISYVGQTAPKSRVAMYMGYLFLYGVIGSSIGAPLGANLYVKFVDELNQPRTLWLIFTSIGVATLIGLLLYNRFLVPRDVRKDGDGKKS